MHAYLKSLKDRGASQAYLNSVQARLLPLIQNGLPPILTLGHLAHVTDSNFRFLHRIADRRVDPYRTFKIAKRNGGSRSICVPDAMLMRVQRWIHDEILTSDKALQSISPIATAFLPNSDHLKNAGVHRSAVQVFKFDVENFFESISERQVFRVFSSLGYSPLIAIEFSRLATRLIPGLKDGRFRLGSKRWSKVRPVGPYTSERVGHLPQGAPTSPMLANLVCQRLDEKLEGMAKERNLLVTRYADDITFSAGEGVLVDASSLVKEVKSTVGKLGLRINKAKTSVARQGARRIVTGLLVDGKSLRLPRQYKLKVRQELYYIRRFGLKNHCSQIGRSNQIAYLLGLAGRIRYIRRVEPVTGNSMLSELVNAVPNFHDIENLFIEK